MAQFFTTSALANHQVGLVICRALHALGELPESELKKLLIPKFSEDDKTTQWDDSLKALKRVKIVLEEPGIVKLSVEKILIARRLLKSFLGDSLR